MNLFEINFSNRWSGNNERPKFKLKKYWSFVHERLHHAFENLKLCMTALKNARDKDYDAAIGLLTANVRVLKNITRSYIFHASDLELELDMSKSDGFEEG